MKTVAFFLCTSHAQVAHLNWAVINNDDSINFVQLALQSHETQFKKKIRPKTQWEEPLSAEDEAEFDKDMHKPIKTWIQENPDLNSDYFVKFGMPRGYWELIFWKDVHEKTDYVAQARIYASPGAGIWFYHIDWLGEKKGPQVTLNIEGSTIISHMDAWSYLPEDAYCWAAGWLKGQGLDGSLISNKKAWEALAEQECNKIGQDLSTKYPEQFHTVYHHVMWNRVWPSGLECNIVDGGPSYYATFNKAPINASSCTPVTKNDLREHAYRKCLFGLGPNELAYCYNRGCLLNSGDVLHGSQCS